MADIKFGTDGWRAVVGKDFNEENVGIVSKAIGKYVFDNFGIDKKKSRDHAIWVYGRRQRSGRASCVI